MPNEELYRSLYSKYAPNLSEEDLNEKMGYALSLNPSDFIHHFYQRYTGAAPTAEQSEYINTIIETAEPTTEPVVAEPEIEHISQEDFVDISSGGFGTPIFGKGREEIMSEKLYDTYNPDRTEDGVQFTQYGGGNNVRVTLPNGEQEDFELPGVGGVFGGETGEAKDDYVRLTQFIESDKKKVKIDDEKKSNIENIILNRRREDLTSFEKVDGELRPITGDAISIFNDELDDNVAKELNLLGLKNKKGSYSFEASKWFKNAIEITTPNNSKKTIDIGSLVGNDDEKKKKIFNTIQRFIESDPESYEMTEEYNNTLEDLKEVAEPYLQPFIDNPEKAINLLSETNKNKLKKQLRAKLKLDHQSWFDNSNMVFKDITRDQQNELVDQMVQTTIDNAMDKISLDLSTKERKDLESQGYDLKMVYDHVDKRTGERFSGLNKDIFDLNLKLDNENLSKTDRKTLVDEVDAKKHLKVEKYGEEYSFFIDMNTMSRSMSSGEGENVMDLSKEVEDRANKVEAENLTRPQLKERYVNANLAYDEWEDKRNTDNNIFIISPNKVEYFSNSSANEEVEIKQGGDTREYFNSKGQTITKGQTYSYVTMTDKEASRGSNYMWLELKENAVYQGRLQHGVDLKVNREVYDKQYGLNEGIKSQNVQTWYESVGTNFVRGFTGKEYELKHGIPDDQFRQAFLEVQTDELGIDATAEEKEAAKSTFGETTGAAGSGLPKMVFDFWIGNKVLATTGVIRTVGSLVNNLRKSRYAIKIGGKTKNLNETQLLNHISKSGKSWNKGVKNIKPHNGSKEAIIVNWLKANKYGKDVIVPASIINQGSAVALNGLLEGVKMEVAMQSPTSQIFGIGDPDDLPTLGSSYAMGFGFGSASSIIPWNRMFTSLVGKANVGKGFKIPGTKSKYPGTGGKTVPKEIAYKGMYDYLVAAPWSFAAGAQFGSFTNQIADDMMGNRTWNSWLDENFSDWGTVLKHTATELITGLALKIGHGKKYDFASESKLWNLQRASRQKLREEVYEDIVKGKDGKLYKRTVKNGVEMIEPATSKYRKGKTELDAEKYESIVSLTQARISEIRDTKQFLDPIQGPIRFMEKWKPHLKEMGETENLRFTFDNNIDKMNIRFVKPGQKFHKGGVNNTGKEVTEATFNPKNVSVDYLPHELLHFMTYKKMGKKGDFSGEDVMFKNRVVDGLIELAKEMEYGDGRTLYEAAKDAGVLKEGRYKGERNQTKEWELFSYIAEFYGKEGNQEMIESKYGYDKLASFTDKLIKENFNGAHTPLNTQKDLALFFGNYARHTGEGGGITGSLKHLEKFVSPTKTKKQQKAREEFEKFWGIGETKELKTQDLSKKIEKKQKEIKSHPAFIQFQEDRDVKKYANNPKIKELLSDLKVMKENLKNIPEDVTWGQESSAEKKVNDFARVGNRMMTNTEWNAKGGGKDKAMLELYKEDGAFVGIITRGIDFSKGGIEGRSRETWIEDVSFGIEGKGRKGKETGEHITTFVTKGIRGVLEKFKPETDLQGKESLSGWVNRLYQLKRGDVYNYYEANPLGQSLEAKAGEGKTVGDKLLAPADLRLKKFENVNILEEAFAEGKEVEFKEVVAIEGERKVKNEIPIERKVFEEENGWQETVLENTPKRSQMEEMGYRDIIDLAPEFTEQMYGIKLTDAQRKNLNDIGGETNLKNGQNSVRSNYKVQVLEQAKIDGKTKIQPKYDANGVPVVKNIKNSQRIADSLPSGTVKFDKGVSDALVGRSAFARLGTLGELYHLATPKNYTRAELRELGFETGETPHKDGYWRAATGPGGRVYIKGKAKGQELTGEDVERYVGVKEDGTLTKLSEDRSIGGKLRRLISEDGKHITEQVMTESMDLNANILANLKGGKSRSFWSRTLSTVMDHYTRNKFLEEVRSAAFHNLFYEEMQMEMDKKNGSPEKATINAVQKHFKLLTIKDPNFKIVNEPIVDSVTGESKKVLSENQTLKNIAKEVFKEFRFTTRPEGIVKGLVDRAWRAVERPNSLEGVESKWIAKGEDLIVIHGPSGTFGKQEITDGIVHEMKEAERLTLKYGRGVYEAHLLDGVSGGAGIGKYSSLMNMELGITSGLGYTIFRSANAKYTEGKGKAAEEGDITYDAYAMLDAVYRKIASDKKIKVEDLKKYGETLKDGTFVPTATRKNQRDVGVKVEVMKALGVVKGGKKFDQANADKLYEYGEKNKDMLLDSIEGLAEAYKNNDVSQRVVRQWVEMHAGSMDGLIKTSASLAVLPNVKMSDLIKKYGTKPEDWVLEHITPAQHLKARIYDYILSKGDKTLKKEMELSLRDHHTTLIPEKYDTMVNKTLQADLPASHRIGIDFPLQSRYYEAQHPSDFDLGLRVFAGRKKGETYDHHPNLSLTEKAQKRKEVGKDIQKVFPKNFRKVVAKNYNSKNLELAKNIDKALELARKKDKKSRGMSTFDFDKTAGDSENFIFASKGKEKKKISADKWPFVGEQLKNEGWKFDFTDFNKVTKGKPGPLMQKLKNQIKKYSNKDVFILTARAQESAQAIFDFLKSEGAEIPLKNIVGLGNSTGEAKALWMLEKFSEGYNDMYFVDDALPNVKAVKNVLDQLDIKSNVQIARQFNSKNLSSDINNIMESTFGIESKKRFSTAEGKARGKDKKRRKLFIPDSAADLELLMEPLYGKGKKGKENKKWFEKNFYKPWERGVNDLNTARQTILNDYLSLRKTNKDIVKSLDKPVEGTNFTVDQAARVYIWNKAKLKVPGLTDTSENKLLTYVESNPKLKAYAESVAKLTKIETGLKQPKDTWWAETIASEVSETGRTVNRDKYIGEWIERKNEIFSEENMAKMESELGPKWRESVEDMLYRMETGTTRKRDLGRIGNNIMNYLNGSVGAIMNLNTRSATLQLISSVNFINHAENNPFAAAKAFANQPQYWKDFMRIMNSDMLKQRRAGLKINVTEAELATAVDREPNKAKKALAWILKQGYIPTKIADSFAIASGGATYYRNRIKMYEKQGLTTKEAEKKAWVDFQGIAERTQQSSRPDLLSKQQVSFEGRLILPFANTPMQMNRIMMKELLDISKGRYTGSFGENSFTNKMSKVAYYGVIQSMIFAGLQSGLFALMANDADDDIIATKKVRAYNTVADSFLRGMGITGATVAAIKNATFKFLEQNERGFRADYSEVSEALLNISPTIGSKFSKMDAAGNTYQYNKKEILEKGLSLDNTKALEASATVIEAITNVPIARVVRKTQNIQDALDEENDAWQRLMMLLGWSAWDVGVAQEEKKKEKKEKEKKKGKGKGRKRKSTKRF